MRKTVKTWRYVAGAAVGLALALGLTACGGGQSGGSSGAMSVSVSEPTAGSTVALPFSVRVDSSVPLGATSTGRHHVHIWFDGNADNYRVVESDTTQITDLAAGQHTMHVSLRNANHSAAGAETEVSITVTGGAGPNPTGSAAPPDYGY